MSDSVRPHRRQPTRLPRPWDSPGKNTGVGCHFLLQCMKVKSESEVAQSRPTLCDPMDCSLPGSSVHGISRQEYWSGVPLPSPVYPLTAPNIVNEIFIIAQWLYEKWLQLIFLQVLNFKYEFDFKKWNCDLKLCMLADHLNYIFWKQGFKFHFFIFQQTFPKCH